MTSLRGLAVALCALLVQASNAQPIEAGGQLRSSDGRSLYTFAKDADGQSQCHDACVAAWPPLMASAGAQAQGGWTLHARREGGQQWGWKGQPLYRFASDANPGDANGDGQGGVWRLAKPARPAVSDTSKPAYSSSY